MTQKSTTQWSPVEKLHAVIEYNSLSGKQQGAFLRSRGLTSQDIKRFATELEDSLSQVPTSSRGRPAKSDEEKRLNQELKATKKKLRRNERALAETTARVVLLKKRAICSSGRATRTTNSTLIKE